MELRPNAPVQTLHNSQRRKSIARSGQKQVSNTSNSLADKAELRAYVPLKTQIPAEKTENATVHPASPSDSIQVSSESEVETRLDYADAGFTAAVRAANPGPSIPSAVIAYLVNTNRPVEYVGDRNPDATVLVVDDFFQDQLGLNHGETVVGVIKRAGLEEKDLQRVNHTDASIETTRLLLPGPESPSERIDKFIELTAAEMISGTCNIIKKTAGAPDSKIKTISHSMGTAALEIGFSLMGAAVGFNEETGRPEFRILGTHIFEGLGLKPELSRENLQVLQEKALQRSHEVLANSDLIKSARESLDQELANLKVAKGVSYFVAAGNSEEALNDVREFFPLADSAAYSVLSVSNANLVGAINTKGTADTSDDELAGFSTRDPNVKFLANGVGIETQASYGVQITEGTSFATPHVAAKAELARRNGLELYELPEANDNWSGPLAIL